MGNSIQIMSEGIKSIPDKVVTDPVLAYKIAYSADADRGVDYSTISFAYSQYKKITDAALRLTISSPRPIATKTDEFWLLNMRVPNLSSPGKEEINDTHVRPFVDEVFNSGIPGATSQSFKGQNPMISVPDVYEVAVRAAERAQGLKIRLAMLEFAVVEAHELELAKKRRQIATDAVTDLI